jgi:hypothetical protein
LTCSQVQQTILSREFREWARVKFLNWKFCAIRGQSKNEKAAVRPPHSKTFKGRFAQLYLRLPDYITRRRLLAACGHAAAENALKAIFVNHRSHRILAFFIQGAHHASGAIHLNIGIGSQDGSGQNNAEANHCSHPEQAFGMKKHAAG